MTIKRNKSEHRNSEQDEGQRQAAPVHVLDSPWLKPWLKPWCTATRSREVNRKAPTKRPFQSAPFDLCAPAGTYE